MSDTDKVYARAQKHVVDFAFDENVARVFPDMIRRSVPGYETIISLLGVLGEKYVLPGSCVYDIGCSLGASTLSVYSRVQDSTVRFIGIDNSADMLNRCRENLAAIIPESRISLRLENAQDSRIEQASMVVMNFTLQFMAVEDRQKMMEKIYQGLLPGGILVLSEKLRYDELNKQNYIQELHQQFKSSNGYSDLEISQKRTALENVMVLDSEEIHIKRMQNVGFETVFPWFECLGFISFLAIKS